MQGVDINSFIYDINFVAGTAKGGTQPYGDNTDDGRFFIEANSNQACYVENAAGLLVLQAAAGLRRTDKGHCQYPPNNMLALWKRDLTNAVYTATNVTVAKNQTGADGVAASASSLTATGANGTVSQSITASVNTYIFRAYIKRLVGVGVVEMSLDGTNFTDVTAQIAAGYQLVWTSRASVTNPVPTYRIATIGDSIAVDFSTVHAPNSTALQTLPSRYSCADTTSATNLSQSRPTMDIFNNGPLAAVLRGPFAFYYQCRSERTPGAVGFNIFTGDTQLAINIQSNGSIAFASHGGGSAFSAVSQWRTGLSQVNKVAGWINNGVVKVCANGSAVGSNTGAIYSDGMNHTDLGTNGAGTTSIFGFQERIAISPNMTFSDAALIAMTT